MWRKAGFSFFPSAPEIEEGSTTSSATTTDVVFGVMDRDLLNGPGGVFFGLIKETDRLDLSDPCLPRTSQYEPCVSGLVNQWH